MYVRMHVCTNHRFSMATYVGTYIVCTCISKLSNKSNNKNTTR